MARKSFNVFNAGENILYNPTDVDVKFMFDGKEMIIEAGEEITIPSPAIFKWVKTHHSDLGLVDLSWTEADKKRFKTYEEYKRVQSLNGLKAMHSFAELTLAREKQAANESAVNGKSSLDKLGFKIDKFEKRLEKIKNKIADLMEEAQEKPEKSKKKREVKDEFAPDKTESETKA